MAIHGGIDGLSQLIDPAQSQPARTTQWEVPDVAKTRWGALLRHPIGRAPVNDRRCYQCASSAEPGCSSTVTHRCESWGDGLCYLLCQSSADCTDPCFPFCRRLWLYAGNEHCGPSSMSVCLRTDRDTCDPSAEQP